MKRKMSFLLGLLAVAVIAFAFTMRFATVTFQYNGGDKSEADNYTQADPDCGTGAVNLCKIQFDDVKFPLVSGKPPQVVLTAVSQKGLNTSDHIETTTAFSSVTSQNETITLIKKS